MENSNDLNVYQLPHQVRRGSRAILCNVIGFRLQVSSCAPTT